MRALVLLALFGVALSAPTWTQQLATIQELSSTNFGDCRSVTGGSGVYTIGGMQVYCEMSTDGGGWLLLLSQTDVHSQYSGSVNPLSQDLNTGSPSVTGQYSRNWNNLLFPVATDQFLLKRGTSGDWVKFVETGSWCGWSNTVDCATNTETSHPFMTNGQTYTSSGSALSGYTYFNGCALGGGCGSSGTDGIGFGDLQGHLRANHGDKAYGGTAWPGGFRWDATVLTGSDTIDTGSNLPYLYFWRPGATTAPTATPTVTPTRSPTANPTAAPTRNPTATPTVAPSSEATSCHCTNCNGHYKTQAHTQYTAARCGSECESDATCKFSLHDSTNHKCWFYSAVKSYTSRSESAQYTCYHK